MNFNLKTKDYSIRLKGNEFKQVFHLLPFNMQFKIVIFLICFFSLPCVCLGLFLEGNFRYVHDPSIIKHDGWYYLFSTGLGVPVKKSKDLFTWIPSKSVFEKNPNWASKTIPQVKDLWAPDICFYNNEYHLYYSVSSQGNGNKSAIGLATNKTLDQASSDFKWKDKGMVIDSIPGRDDFNAIDPNFILDEANKPWLAFGSYWDGIKIIQIDEKTGKRSRTNQVIYSIASRNGGAIEAPFIIKKNGFFYLFVSFDACCRGTESTYKTMCGRSKKITGPYLDFTGKSMTEGGGTLVLSSYKNIRGPGHNAILVDKPKDYFIHHFYDATANGLMTLQIRPLFWLANGWPIVGEPITKDTNVKTAFKMAGKWRLSVDYQNEREIYLNDNGHINEKNSPNTWDLRASNLTLKWSPKNGKDKVFVDDCIVSPDGRYFVGRNQYGAVISGIK